VRDNRYKLQQVQSEYKERLFPHEDSMAVERVTPGGCAISVLGGLHAPTDSSPEQSGLTPELGLLWEGVWTRDLTQSLPT